MEQNALKKPFGRVDGVLKDAIFLSRPHRFALRVYIPEEEQEVEAHLADPGRLTHLLHPGRGAAQPPFGPPANPARVIFRPYPNR